MRDVKIVHKNKSASVPATAAGTARLHQWLSRHGVTLIIGVAVMGMAIMAPITYTNISTASRRYLFSAIAAHKVPKHRVAIVFGAGVLPNGTPTDYLKDRINTAVALYKAGTVQKILMSGDNSTSHHNEPIAMQRYAVTEGIPARDITMDFAGFNTYDSCYRAHAIFGLTSAILVSHGYHLPRAITTCRSLGIDSIGVATSDTTTFSKNYLIREVGSTDKLMFQMLFKPKPTILGPHEIMH